MDANGLSPIIWPLLAKLRPTIAAQRKPRYTAGRVIPMLPVLPWNDFDRPRGASLGRVEGQYARMSNTFPVNFGLAALGVPSRRLADFRNPQRINPASDLTRMPAIVHPLKRNSQAPFYQLGGVTRDAAGAVLGSCVVEVYRTDTDERLLTTTSDASGVFLFTNVPRGIALYLVAYKAGSPDVFGTTVNTLTGA